MNTIAQTMTTAKTVDFSSTDGRLQALFWRSPFAVTAGTVLVAQLVMLTIAGLSSRPMPYEMMIALTAMSATFLTAGIWPNWNYLKVDERGLDQQAGLRSLVVPWSDVQSVRGFDGWVELRIVTGGVGARKVRTVSVFDRYGLGAEAFLDLVETPWLRARRAPGV